MRTEHEIPEGGWREASERCSLGTGVRTGRRPKRLATDKRELYEILERLHAHGLGQNTIAYLLGYSPPLISRLLRDINLPRHNPGTIVSAIIRHLPDGLVAHCRTIKMKSSCAHERAAIKHGLKEHKRVVHVLPED